MKIAIIGGGMAGLGVAYELSQKGHLVTIYEKSNQLGGLASSIIVKGVPLENFYHHIFPTYDDFFEVAKEIGFVGKIFFKKLTTANFYNGKLYPFSGPLDLLSFTPLSFFERIKTGYYIVYLQHTKKWKKFENITATEWLRSHFGERVFDILWEPLLKSKFGEYYSEISMVWFWSRVYERPVKFGYFRGGFKTFIQAIVKYLKENKVKVEVNTEIEKIEKQDLLFTLHTKTGKEVFDKIVVAAPPASFVKIASSILPKEYLDKIKELKYLGNICAILVLKQHFSPYYWININEKEWPFVAVIEQTNFISSDVYGGYHPVYLSRYIDPKDPLYNLPEKELLKFFISYLKKIRPEFKESWISESYAFRSPFAQQVIPVSYESIRPTYSTPDKDFWWVSMSHVYPWDRGTNHSFHSGRELAREMMESFYHYKDIKK